MSRIHWYGPSFVLMLTLIAAVVAGPQLIRNVTYAQTSENIHLAQERIEANQQSLQALSNSFTDVAKFVEPSVVHIQVYTTSDSGNDRGRDMLRRFFGPDNPFENRGQQPDREGGGSDQFEQYNAPRQYGNGSGWVYDAQGHIITNNHVVRLPSGGVAEDIRVRFFNGSEKEASVVATDAKTDIAVLKVEGDDLHPAKIANIGSNPLQQGEMVFAFGSPFRFDFSMSQGIVSAKGRQLGIIVNESGQQGYEDFIQTDAAINPGNSGGPLTNINGEVVGMNTAIASRTGSYNGLGFAIPADMIVNVVDQIINDGAVSRGYLGVYIDDLDARMAQTFGYEGEGVLVVNPIPGSPGAQAGLEAGDIITQVNGEEVASADELRYKISNYAPQESVDVTVYRDGGTQSVEVTLGELPTDGPSQAQASDDGSGEQSNEQGMQALRKIGIEQLETFTEDRAQQLGADFQEGVIILGVRANSIAQASGLSRGMIVTEVMGEEVTTGEELVQAINTAEPGEPVRLRVLMWNPQNESFLARYVLVEMPE